MANNHNSEINTEFLKAPLNAKVSCKDKTTMSLAGPQNVEHTDNLPISELIDKLKGNTSEIENPFGGKIDGAKAPLTMAYLRYLQTEGEATPAENKDTPENAQGETTRGMEYALELEVQDINSRPIFEKTEDNVTAVNKITMAVSNSDDTEPSKMNSTIPAFTTKQSRR